MKTKGKLLLTLFLIMWVAIAFTLLKNEGSRIIGKSYFESNQFQSNFDSFKEQLGQLVLLPFDAEKAKDSLTVTQAEIEQYRNYYGSMTEQIESIQSQYSDRIASAEAENNATLKEQLIAERDQKIADITQNFKSDEYVEEKIRSDREKQIDLYAKEQEGLKKSLLHEYSYFTYSFTNVQTGEKIESPNFKNESVVYSKSYGKQNSLLYVDSSFYINVNNNDSASLEPFTSFDVPGEAAQFEGVIYLPQRLIASSPIHEEYWSFNIKKYILYFIWISGIVSVVALFTFARPSLNEFEVFEKAEKQFSTWPIDIRAVIVFILAMISLGTMDGIGWSFGEYYSIQNLNAFIFDVIFDGIVMFATTSATVIGAIWIWKSIKNTSNLREEIMETYTYRLAIGVKDLLLDRSIAFHTLFVIATAFFAGIGLIGAFSHGDLAAIYAFLFVFVAMPVVLSFLRKIGYLNRIIKQTEDMAEGRLTSDIKVKGKSSLATHARNLNSLREGVRKSMTEQAKSERLKTELITNVSHDLRTPLTSIITYTDLLKKPDITEEERKQYIDVLDKKSARLKTLIEDLFEVSKMASGNIELFKQRLDLTQLFQQAIGEHDESFKEAGLEIKVSTPEQPIIAYVDGQKMWRVLDNLVVNAIKYSLKGSRVYLTLTQNGRHAEFTVKNISNYELSENVEELTERFKRADASRHTDGSGLGLAIAQSIVDLHNGRMKIEVDGDLFKVTVSIPTDY
ncbi:histidine kinase OS=Ureibacillus acetophenoni OX=614649 GN=SAMN05877842_1126 PE=4 SV=1 [Ureibacillus acetophenoni]